MLKAIIDVKLSMWLQTSNIQLTPPHWGSQQIVSTPPQPTCGAQTIF